jgi:cyclopropane-fatty-acyl-phospholipid synthase
MLPTGAIVHDLARRHGFHLLRERLFGADYARTLVHWRHRFQAAWPDLVEQGYDERFRRLWTYYLAYCEAGFRAGTITVRQLSFIQPQARGQ